MRVRHPDGQAFTFDAGTLCLELSSVTGGEGHRARYEVLHSPADFVRWAAASRLDLRAHGVRPGDVVVTEEELALVKRLREAVWAGAWATAGGGAVPPAAATVINEVAGMAVPVPFIAADGARAWRRPVRGDQLAALIARDAVAALTPPTAARVRMCAADDCALIYLDTSRPGNRRWCSMDRCGNRAKVRGHRLRGKEPS
ncbi:CGNR zinc finger domain-containing protein [Actinoplanes sp. NPDC049316]|uniref:CGNR zinc finger domain-containing protein n=1 Tax=Actinoplanes sp. NPDC049316 TaxID=3154727 RepID=UPI00342165F1